MSKNSALAPPARIAFLLGFLHCMMGVAAPAVSHATGRDVRFRYINDDAGRLVAVVNSEGNVVEYAYDTAGDRRIVRRFPIDPFAIILVDPLDAPAGSTVKIHGQGFGATPAENEVWIGDVRARVISAAPDRLDIEVPGQVDGGRIRVRRGIDEAVHHSDFFVTRAPSLEFIRPGVILSSTYTPTRMVGVEIRGQELFAATFAFLPQRDPPMVEVVSREISPDGTRATLEVLLAPGAHGRFELVATNSAGSALKTEEDAVVSLEVYPHELDSDGDGITDFDEAFACTDALDPDSDADGFSDRDEADYDADPCDAAEIPDGAIAGFTTASGPGPSFVNVAAPVLVAPRTEAPVVAVGVSFAVLNAAMSAIAAGASERSALEVASGPPFALLNHEAPPMIPHGGEHRFVASRGTLSIFNASWREGAEAPILLPAQQPLPEMLLEELFAMSPEPR